MLQHKVTEIEFHQAEGLVADCVARTFGSWAQVDRWVKTAAMRAPADGSYYKCDVTITWEDGYRAKFRFDMDRTHASDPAAVSAAFRAHIANGPDGHWSYYDTGLAVTQWSNRTPADAHARVVQAQIGANVDASVVYLIALRTKLYGWIEQIDAELQRRNFDLAERMAAAAEEG